MPNLLLIRQPVPRRAAVAGLAAVAAVALALGGLVPPASAASEVVAEVSLPAGSGPRGVAVDTEHGVAYVANFNSNTVSVIDIATSSVRSSLPYDPTTGIGKGPRAIAIDESIDRAYVTNALSGTVSVIDTATSAVISVIPHDVMMGIGGDVRSVALDTGLNRAYATNLSENSISVIDTNSNTVIKVIGGIKNPIDIAIDTALHKAYVVNDMAGTLSIIDTSTNALLSIVPRGTPGGIGPAPQGVAVDSVNNLAYVTDFVEHSIIVIDTSRDLILEQITVPFDGGGTVGLSEVEVDPASKLLFIGDDGGESGLTILNTATGSVERNFPRASGFRNIGGVAFDPETSTAWVTHRFDNKVSVIEVDEGVGAPGVSRVAGADRYEGAAKVSAAAFSPGVKVAYVASGVKYPDALSGAAAAGGKGPVLLVQPDAVPAVVEAELARLKPERIVVLGGTDSVSRTVESALQKLAPRVQRITGADRYAVSAGISGSTFPVKSNVAYVASGENFADALSGSAAAGAKKGPVLLVQKNTIPDAIKTELARLQPAAIVVLGGSDTISDAVLTQLRVTAPTTRIGGVDRYAVSAATSAGTFLPNTPTAYVASGETFADALPGGAAAIPSGAPMLLVQKNSVPAAVAAELDRLRPTRIVVLGGADTISDAVLEKLKDHLRP